MFLRATGVLLLWFLPLYCTHVGEQVREKSLFLEKLTRLYQNLGLDGETLARRHALMGLLSSALNTGKTPREEMTVLDMELTEGIENSFEARLLTDSLQASLEYHQIRGTVDFSRFEVLVGSLEKLNLSSYAGKRLRGHSENLRLEDINNGSKGIHELLKMAYYTQCKKNEVDECERGSVVMDTWVNRTLAFQRWLQRDLTFDLIQTLGTHNSFNTKADGYGKGDFTLGIILEALSDGKWEFVWAQQWFTMTDQLRMGARHLQLDPVYFWGKMRLCHCGTSFKWIDAVLDAVEKALNISLQFDSSDIGCMPHDKTIIAGLQEIFDWVVAPGNQEEITMIHINDERYDADWGHIDLIQDPVVQIFGKLLFTPTEKATLFPQRWPTPNELLKLEKRVIVTCTSRCNDSHIFLDMHVPNWDHDTPKYFTAAPECGGFGAGQFYLMGGESMVIGQIFNGPELEGLIIRENFPYLMQCPITVSEMDLASPQLIAAAVWSWAPGYSAGSVSSTQCPAVDVEREGRWVVLSCTTWLVHMCQRTTNITDIVLSSSSAPWGQAQCPKGYVFSLPQTGYVNWNLTVIATHTSSSHVWINLPPMT